MREIKFRVWDTDRNMFVPQGEIVFKDYGDTSIEVIPNDLSYIGDKCHNGEPQRGRFKVQQCTGLKDDNGKDIYEGDIMYQKYQDAQEETGVGEIRVPVVFQDGSFGWMGDITNKFHSFFDEPLDDYEIIGNIYENPELLITLNN